MWEDWNGKFKKCPDKFEPGKLNEVEQTLKEVKPAIKKYFDSSYLKDFNVSLVLHPAMRTYVLDIEWKDLRDNPICKEIRLTPDLPSPGEICEGFEKQIKGDQLIKPFLESEFLENLKNEERNNQEKTTPEE